MSCQSPPKSVKDRFERWLAVESCTRLKFDEWLAEHHPEFTSWEIKIAGKVYPCAVSDYDKVVIQGDSWLDLKEKIERRAQYEQE